MATIAGTALQTASVAVETLTLTQKLVLVPTLVLLFIVTAAWLDVQRKTVKPTVTYRSTRFNDGVMSRMPTLKSVYKPLMFTTNGHVETIFAAKLRRKCDITYRRETVIMSPDQGIVSLDWRVPFPNEKALPDDAPVLILFPGLTGGSADSYVRYAAQYAELYGVRAVVFNARGCGDAFVTTPQFYSAVWIEDTKQVVEHVRKLYPSSNLFATGWSLGANILVNYLGIMGSAAPLSAAAALCNPFDLTISDKNLRKGFNKVYDANLGKAMSGIMQRNAKVWNGAGPEFNLAAANNSKTVREWDDAITRVSFGYPSVDDYYADAGSHQRVKDVTVPLLVIQAADDPIAPLEATPQGALLDNENCILAVTPTGGHLGWMSGDGGYFGEPWTDRVIVEWLLSVQIQIAAQQGADVVPSTAPSTVRPHTPTHDPEWVKRRAAAESPSPQTARQGKDVDDEDNTPRGGAGGSGNDAPAAAANGAGLQTSNAMRDDAAPRPAAHGGVLRMGGSASASPGGAPTSPYGTRESRGPISPGSVLGASRLQGAGAAAEGDTESTPAPGTAFQQKLAAAAQNAGAEGSLGDAGPLLRKPSGATGAASQARASSERLWWGDTPSSA